MGTNTSAYLLVYHGSRDSRPKIFADRLAWEFSRIQELSTQQLRESVFSDSKCLDRNSAKNTALVKETSQETNIVSTVPLELAVKPLSQQIIDFARFVEKKGLSNIQILPLFLLAGVHLKEDIPSEVAIAQNLLGKNIKLTLRPHLGSHPGLESLIEKKFNAQILNGKETPIKIIVSHGSRRPQASNQVKAIAGKVGAAIAYASIPPSLEAVVTELLNQKIYSSQTDSTHETMRNTEISQLLYQDFSKASKQQFVIMPYNLFPGSITDTIALNVEKLKLQFPDVSFQLLEPLGKYTELTKLIWDLVENEPHH